MTWLTAALLVVLLLGFVTVVLSWTAGRHDRLHIRLATARSSLHLQLSDRIATTMRVASSQALDPASALVLLAAAEEARAANGTAGHEQAESSLSQTLRAVLGDAEQVRLLRAEADEPDRSALLDLAGTCERVRFAAHFHDELCDRTVAMRRRRLVALLHLAGHAPWPTRFVFDDEPPQGLLTATSRPPSGVPES
ncbi:MAG: hypothetical protein M3419_12325 [Actinomycetota bacterium]|nr:hypothetical protein [Actinomycetota bacterium]